MTTALPVGVWLAAGAAYWLAQSWIAVRATGSVPMLRDIEEARRTDWPRVSVLICAKDEEPTISRAIESRLADGYPALEFILVDDRSTDATGEVMDSFARRDTRVKVLHITELPDGWLGKLHALHRGLELATGDWLLLSDADVIMRDGTIAKAVSYAETECVDHIPMIPEFLPSNLLTDAAMCVFMRLLGAYEYLAAVRHRDRQPPVGSGAFNLIRRSAFDRTKGCEWLRMDIAEDFTLSQLLHDTGATTCLVNGRGYVSLRFFDSLAGAAAAAERTVFAATGDFKVVPLAAVATGMLALELSPFAPFITRGPRWLRCAGLAWVVAAMGLCAVTSRRLNGPPGAPSLAFPLGAAVVAWLIARSAVVGRRRGGLLWRGTFYPTAMLKEGKRIELF